MCYLYFESRFQFSRRIRRFSDSEPLAERPPIQIPFFVIFLLRSRKASLLQHVGKFTLRAITSVSNPLIR